MKNVRTQLQKRCGTPSKICTLLEERSTAAAYACIGNNAFTTTEKSMFVFHWDSIPDTYEKVDDSHAMMCPKLTII